VWMVSIHAPVKERRDDSYRSVIVAFVSIHAPVKERLARSLAGHFS